MFTDGMHNVEEDSTIPENVLLKNTGDTTVITVSVGASGFVDFGVVNMIASRPVPRNVFNTTRFGWVQNLTSDVLAAACNST